MTEFKPWLTVLMLISPIILFCESSFAKALSGLNTEDFKRVVKDDVEWQKNPFLVQVGDVKVTDLKLKATVFSEEKQAALINRQIVYEGAEIGKHKVMSIRPNHVVLKNSEGIFRISFEGRE